MYIHPAYNSQINAMNRRELIRTVLQAGAAASVPVPHLKGETAVLSTDPPGALPTNFMGTAAIDSYFSDEALFKALGTRTLQKPTDVQVIAFNFPSWHPSPYMESLFGKGWTEYDTLRNAKGLFPGHTMPHFPLWGYYNEADPVWAAREIDLAADYGVNAWMIDWYWHNGRQFYQEQLEQGMLKAPNRSRLKFAIMWASTFKMKGLACVQTLCMYSFDSFRVRRAVCPNSNRCAKAR